MLMLVRFSFHRFHHTRVPAKTEPHQPPNLFHQVTSTLPLGKPLCVRCSYIIYSPGTHIFTLCSSIVQSPPAHLTSRIFILSLALDADNKDFPPLVVLHPSGILWGLEEFTLPTGGPSPHVPTLRQPCTFFNLRRCVVFRHFDIKKRVCDVKCVAEHIRVVRHASCRVLRTRA